MPDDALITTPQTGALAVTGDAAQLMAVIAQAASNPNVDPDKLERLMSMYERITAGRAKSAFDAALSEMQPKLPVVDRRGLITIRKKDDQEKVIQSTPYALFEDINSAVGPVLAEYGFAVSFRTGLTEGGKVKVTAVLSHRDGHREETSLELMHDTTGSKNSVQAVGSSVSYGKRYTMCALLNITTSGEDDDGETGGKKISNRSADDPNWTGPLLKTALKEKVKAVWADIDNCQDADVLPGLIQDNIQIVNQCARDLPDWWMSKIEGQPNGLKLAIHNAGRELKVKVQHFLDSAELSQAPKK